MTDPVVDELLALYTPEQQVAMSKVQAALLDDPAALDNKKKEKLECTI